MRDSNVDRDESAHHHGSGNNHLGQIIREGVQKHGVADRLSHDVGADHQEQITEQKRSRADLIPAQVEDSCDVRHRGARPAPR